MLAYLANAAFVVFLGIALLDKGTLDGTAIIIFLLLFAFALINFVALAVGKEKDVFSLYFERKRLEQEKKIMELKKNMGKET